MNTPVKQTLKEDLKKSFQDTIDWANAQSETHFNEELFPGKWTAAGHIYHLIKSTKAVSKGMKMPRLTLKTMFGKSNRQERTYDGMYQKYIDALEKANLVAPSKFEAEPGRKFEKESLLNRFQGELDDFISAMDKWEEKDMSVYIMPHPAIGKCTIREFVYFTDFHTKHHLNILKEKYSESD